MYTKIYPIFILIFFFAACEQDTINTYENKTAVVQAYLYAGQAVDSIRVTQAYTYASDDTTLITLDDLVIHLSNAQESTALISAGGGYYRQPGFSIRAGENYLLEFEFNGETISAETFIPEKTEALISRSVVEMEKIEFGGGGFPGGGFAQVDPIELSWDNSEGDYFYVLVENLEENPEYVNSLFENPDAPFRNFNFRTEPEVSDFYAIDPRRQLQQFGSYRVIVFRVNPEYAALYETAGSSSISITQPPSNVANGLGVFTGVSSDTLYFEVKKI